nr:BRO family protein [Eubacteriales bacterium]
MNELKVFDNPEFVKIRTVDIDNEPWFVGKDVASILGYKDTVNALKAHVDDEDKRGWQITTPFGTQQMTIINESGLYALVLSSKLPTAKAFKRWITHDVIPSILKHGAYMTPEKLQEAILNPDMMIQLCQQLKDEQEKNTVLRAKNSALVVENQIMAPKADYFDELVDRNLLTNFTEAAKQLNIKRRTFISFLIDKKYLYRDKKGNLLPYASAKTAGLFEVKESMNEKTNRTGCQTLLTPKGMETFRLLCAGL